MQPVSGRSVRYHLAFASSAAVRAARPFVSPFELRRAIRLISFAVVINFALISFELRRDRELFG